jgi:heat shock protein HspQ
MTINSITNLRGRTFRIGQQVTHTQGWHGIVFKIAKSRLYVEPNNPNQVPPHDRWPLARPTEGGKTEFIRSRDHGLGMGNFKES